MTALRFERGSYTDHLFSIWGRPDLKDTTGSPAAQDFSNLRLQRPLFNSKQKLRDISAILRQTLSCLISLNVKYKSLLVMHLHMMKFGDTPSSFARERSLKLTSKSSFLHTENSENTEFSNLIALITNPNKA